MKTSVILSVLFIAVLAGGFYLYGTPASTPAIPSTPVPSPPESATSSPLQAPTPTPAPGTYTAAEVAAHNSFKSCWTIIGGNVYDLTAWITQHPGGEGAILSICGRNGSGAFAGQHGTDPRANRMLATFKIGALAE